ncbi:carcinoembryonic antigen-related cell adhesion molecule 1-like isoform X1 [Arapaima gigas]
MLAAVQFALLVHSIINTAYYVRSQERVVFAELHKSAILTADYPAIEERNPIKQIEWKKNIKETSKIVLLIHKMPNDTQYLACKNRCVFSGQTLLMDNITKNDEGVYEMSLLLANSSVIIKDISLLLYSPPHIRVSSDNSSDSGLTLRCELRKRELWSYVWLKNNRALPPDGRHLVREGNATLFVTNVTHDDCGNYSCEASSGRARGAALIQLTDKMMNLCPATNSIKVPSHKHVFKHMLVNAAVWTVAAISAAAVLMLFLGLFLMKLQHRRKSRVNGNVVPQNNHIYDEIEDIQSGPAAQNVPRSMCVYKEYIPTQQQGEMVYSLVGPHDVSHTEMGKMADPRMPSGADSSSPMGHTSSAGLQQPM